MKGFLFFLKYAYKKRKIYVFLSIIISVLNSISPVLLIYIPKLILDATLDGFRNEAFIFLSLYILCYFLINLLVSAINYLNGIYGGKLFADFQIDMANKLLDADLSKLESNTFIEQSQRANKYIYADGWGFGYIFSSCLEVITKCITVISYIIIIFTFSPLLVLLNIIFTLISIVIEVNIKKKEKVDNDERIKHERGTSYYSNICSDHKYTKDIRIYKYKSTLINKMKYHYNASINFYKKINKRHFFSTTISNMFYVIQLCLGYFFVINLLASNSISAGDFTLNIAALSMYTGLMGQIMNKLVYIKSYDMYFEDFKNYMSIPNMSIIQHPKSLEIKDLEFEFINVSYKYPGSINYAIKNINLKFNKNDRIAVVGENGSGKTTFIKLLMRLYDPTEGVILLNKVDIKEYLYDDYIELFSAVFQDITLFATTIKENIIMDETTEFNNNFLEELKSIGLLKKVFQTYPKNLTLRFIAFLTMKE